MSKQLLRLFLISFSLLAASRKTQAQESPPDTVRTGIYITSIHNIDFKQKEYSVAFWLWLKYKDKDFDFMQNLEVPLAKSVSRSFVTVDSSGGQVYMLMKLQCVMKDSWRINDFPFDHQKLRLSIESAQFDARSLVFLPDTLGKHYDPRFTLSGWEIDSCVVSVGRKAYETTFGDPSLKTPHSVYSSFRVVVNIKRNAAGLFWKMFIGMYVAFLIAYICFYIHADNIDSRFAISVGSLFAVIGNKYIIDSALPESTSFTLVDTLHGLTLLFIFAVIAATTYSLSLVKKGKLATANKFDMVVAQVLLLIYLGFNFYFIALAARG